MFSTNRGREPPVGGRFPTLYEKVQRLDNHTGKLHVRCTLDMTNEQLLLRVRETLSPDLLQPRYRKEAIGKCREYGHCYVATEALWHLIGGRYSGYRPRYAIDGDGDTHWWLENGSARLDPTSPQYTRTELRKLYVAGVFCGFLTSNPSRRAQIVMNRVRAGVTIVHEHHVCS